MQGLAKKMGKSDDAVTRQRIMGMHAFQETARLNGVRARASAQAGKMPGPEVSTGKLSSSASGRMARDLGLLLVDCTWRRLPALSRRIDGELLRRRL